MNTLVHYLRYLDGYQLAVLAIALGLVEFSFGLYENRWTKNARYLDISCFFLSLPLPTMQAANGTPSCCGRSSRAVSKVANRLATGQWSSSMPMPNLVTPPLSIPLPSWSRSRRLASECAERGRYSSLMRPLRYSINVTLDGCCDHRVISTAEDLHRNAVEKIHQADALLFGRVTYEMMEAAFRPPAPPGARPHWMEPFARAIGGAKKYVVSSTLHRVDWNAQLIRGDLGKAVQGLKQESGKGLLVGGVKLPLALAELGLIDEYEFVVHPTLAGRGPTLFAGLSKPLDLRLVSRLEFGSGAAAMRYVPTTRQNRPAPPR